MTSTTVLESTHPKVNPWRVLSVTSLGVLLVMVNLGALNVALPAIARHFQTPATVTNWILLSFMLVSTVMILILGQFSDALGRRNLYLLGMAVFTAVSFVMGFAPNVWTFIVLRALQAVGGAFIIVNNTALITDVFPESELGIGLGINVLISSAAQLIGPVVGGVVASRLGWQWVFWAAVPFGLIGVFWGIAVLRHVPAAGSGKRIDWLGGVITFFTLGGLIVALSEGSSLGWGSGLVLAGFALFAGLTPILVWVELRVDPPMLDFTLFRKRSYAMANVAAFLNAFSRTSVVLLVSLYLQSIVGMDAFWAGFEVLPVTIGMLVASPIAGALSNRLSARILSTLGLLISAIGLVLIMFGMRPALLMLPSEIGMALVGFGSGLFLTPNTRSIMTSVPVHRRGFANGLRSMLQNMGQVLSTAICLTIVTSALPHHLQNRVYTGAAELLPKSDLKLLTTGYRWAFFVLLIATLCGMGASLFRGTTVGGQ